MRICNNCGAELEEDLVFCTECGAKQEPLPAVEPVQEPEPEQMAEDVAQSSAFCVHCGTALEPESTFCTHCGASVSMDAEGVAAAAPVGAAAPKATNSGKHSSKKLLMVVAAVVAVLVVGFLGLRLFGSISPNRVVVKAMASTIKQLEKSSQGLENNVELLSIIKKNLPKANTQTLKLEFDSGSALGVDGATLSNLSPEIKLESDIHGKSLYGELSAMGFSFYGCAKDSLVGVNLPMLYGDKVLAVDTKTIGADLEKYFPDLDLAKELDLPEGDFSQLSFCIFDKTEVTVQNLANGILGNYEDYKVLKADVKKLLAQAVAGLEVEKEGKTTIDFADDKTVKGTEYVVKIPASLQKKLLLGLMDSAINTAYAKNLLMEEGVTQADVEDAKTGIRELPLPEYKVLVVVDNKGRLVSMRTTIAVGLQASVKLSFAFNDYNTLINDFEGKASVSESGEVTGVTLHSQGNHTGKGGEFSDETSLKLVADGNTMSMNSNTDYTVKKGEGELSSVISLQGPDSEKVGIKLSGETATSKGKKTATIHLNRLEMQMNGASSAPIQLSAKYGIKPGVSGKAGKFFDKDETIQLLRQSPEELYELLGSASW